MRGASRFSFAKHDGIMLGDVPLCFVRSSPSGHVFRRMDVPGFEVELTDACLGKASRSRAYQHLPRRYVGGGRPATLVRARPASRRTLDMAEFADGSESRGPERFGKVTVAAPAGRSVIETPGVLTTAAPTHHRVTVGNPAPDVPQEHGRAQALPRHDAGTARAVGRAWDAARVGDHSQVRAPIAGPGSSPGVPARSVSPALGSRQPQGANKGHGSTTVITPDRRMMPAESLTEGKVILGLLALPMVTHLVEQPHPIRYRDEDGRAHWFTFDLLAEVVGGRRILFEVKPAALAQWKGLENFLRFIAPQIGRDRADAVGLLTERHVPPAVLHDAKIISSSRRCPSPADDECLLAALPSGGARLADLGVTTGLRGRAVRAAARLLGSGVLVKAAPGRIGPDLCVEYAGGDA